MPIGSPAEEEEPLHGHLQALVYHPHLQGTPVEVLHASVGCVAGALQKGGRLDPGVVDLLQAEAVAAELSVSELSLQLPASAPPKSGY